MAKQIIVIEKPDVSNEADMRMIAESVRFVRGSIGMTIEDAAAMLGVSKQSLNDLEKAKPGCRVSTLLKVMNGFGIKLKIELPKV